MGKLGIIIYPSFNQNPAGSTDYHARLAQSVEHQTFNLRVAGSSPSSGDGNFEEPKITKMQKKRRLGPSFKKLPQVTVFDVF